MSTANESKVVLKRKSFAGDEEPATDGEPFQHPWTSAASWALRMIAFGWFIQALFAIGIGWDAAADTKTFSEMIVIIFHGIDSVFISLTLGFCLMAASELAVPLARFIFRNAT